MSPYATPVEQMTDEEWQAQSDAETLVQASQILDDEDRLNKAKEAAKKMAEEKLEAFTALLEVAGQSMNQMFKGFKIS